MSLTLFLQCGLTKQASGTPSIPPEWKTKKNMIAEKNDGKRERRTIGTIGAKVLDRHGTVARPGGDTVPVTRVDIKVVAVGTMAP